MGVAAGMGIDTYWAASAILCAAVIGDGLSPLSDTPNVIAGATNVDVFKKCNFSVAYDNSGYSYILRILCVYGGVWGCTMADTSTISNLVIAIEDSYNLGVWCLIPVILVFGLLIFEFPAIPASFNWYSKCYRCGCSISRAKYRKYC